MYIKRGERTYIVIDGALTANSKQEEKEKGRKKSGEYFASFFL